VTEELRFLCLASSRTANSGSFSIMRLTRFYKEGEMEPLEITWRRALSVYWLLAWRMFIGSVLIGFILGFLTGTVGFAIGLSPEVRNRIVLVVVPLPAIWWGVFVVKMALRKHYSDFRIVLVASVRPEKEW
jgi:hypothetical protein